MESKLVRLAFRDLLKHPGYTSASLLTLALVIGANTAIFSAVHAVLLKPSAIRDPQELVVCWERERAGNAVVEVSYRNFQDWAAQARSFSHVAAVGSSTWPVVLDGRGESTRLSSAGVSASFFDTLGVTAAAGRAFRAEDDLPNAPRVAVLSHGVWVRRFGADPAVVGTTIQLDRPHTVVGVMPEGFDFPRGVDVWLPIVPILANAGGGKLQAPLESVGVLFVIGRLRDGVEPKKAEEELDRVAAEVARSGGTHRFGDAVVVKPFLEYVLGPVRQALWALFAAVGVLLLIGCANVSGLMLTRVSARQREHAVRVALGATPALIARHWMLETSMLASLGGALGLLSAHWIAQAVVALAPGDVPRVSEISITWPVAGFTFLAVLATTVLCGVQPIRMAGRVSLLDALNDAARSTPGKQTLRARSFLIVFQIGLTVVLLVSAGLVVRSFINLRAIDLGFVPSNVLTMTVQPRIATPARNEWTREFLARVADLPGVEAAGAISLRPLALGPIGSETWVILEGQALSANSARQNPTLNYQVATPGYFKAMRIRLLSGRLFDDRDTARSPKVALVSESAARRLWRGEDPLGKRILMPGHAADGGLSAWRTVVGVVGDVRYRGIDDPRLDIYDAALQAAMTTGEIVIRTSSDPPAVAAAVQAEARRLDPRVLIDRLTTMDAIVSRAVAPWRFSMWTFTTFAVLAFVLASVGLVSLVSLDTANRRHEFAVRLALGAQRGEVRRSVLLAALARAVPAIAAGVLAALVVTRLIRRLLFGVEPVDVPTYAGVVLLVLVVVTAASWLPARRAAGLDPLALLRRE